MPNFISCISLDQLYLLLVKVSDKLILPTLFTALGVVGALWYEDLGKPNLLLDDNSDDTLDGPIGSHYRRSLRVRVKNVPGKFSFVKRNTAMSCHGNIVFLDDDKKFISGPMPIRWADSPEPIKKQMNGTQIITLPEYNLVRVSKFIDIPPDESELIDLAIRFKGETEAYGWCTDSYFKGNRHPDYELKRGFYYALITLFTGDSKFELPLVKISNPANFDYFGIEYFCIKK